MTRMTGRAPARRIVLTSGGLGAFLTLAHTATDSLTSMVSALLPTLQARFGLTETALALLVAALSFSASVTQPLFGAVADRLGRRLVAGLGIILTTSLVSLVGVVPTLPLLFGLLLVGGLGPAAFHPAATSIARTAGGRRAGLAVSLFGAGGMLGVALGPVLVLLVVAALGLGVTPWLMVPGVVLGALTLVLVPPQERCARGSGCPKLFDARLLTGPVGLLAVAGILSNIAFVTFTSAMPLWLVAQGVGRDATLIGWTLAAFSLSAALGGVIAGALSTRVSRRLLVAGSILLAPLPLFAALLLDPGTPLFLIAVILAGALVNAGTPLMVVSAQDLAPHAVATASGMLMGLTTGVAGVLYIGVGSLQEWIGIAPAMSLSYLTLIPGALLSFAVLTRYRTPERPQQVVVAVAGTPCACGMYPNIPARHGADTGGPCTGVPYLSGAAGRARRLQRG